MAGKPRGLLMREKSMNEIEILITEESDIHEINQVLEKHYSFPPVYFKPAFLSEPADIVQREKNIIFIAKKRNEIIGFLTLYSREPFIHNDNDAEFEIVVNPDFRNHGIGKKLLKSAIQYAENETGLKQLKAKIPTGNDASKKLCEHCGFRLLYKESKGFVMILEIAC